MTARVSDFAGRLATAEDSRSVSSVLSEVGRGNIVLFASPLCVNGALYEIEYELRLEGMRASRCSRNSHDGRGAPF